MWAKPPIFTVRVVYTLIYPEPGASASDTGAHAGFSPNYRLRLIMESTIAKMATVSQIPTIII